MAERCFLCEKCPWKCNNNKRSSSSEGKWKPACIPFFLFSLPHTARHLQFSCTCHKCHKEFPKNVIRQSQEVTLCSLCIWYLLLLLPHVMQYSFSTAIKINMRPSQRQFETRISTNASSGQSIWLWTDALPLPLPLPSTGHDFWLYLCLLPPASSRCHCIWRLPVFTVGLLLFFYNFTFFFFIFFLDCSFFVAWNYYLWVRIVVARFESDLNPRPGPNRIASDRIVRLSSAICGDGSICAFLLSAWKRNFTINQIICMQFNVSFGHKSMGCSQEARAVGIV